MLLKPQRAQAEKVRADTAIEQSKLGPLESQLAQAQSDAAHQAEFKAELDSLQSAMPNSPALAAFIRDANNISQASGASWISVTHGPPTLGVDGVTTIAVGIQVKGTYAQVMDYQTRLAALQRLVVVNGVQFATTSDTGTATGSSAAGGGSTGPFSGGDELNAVITAEMFESPGAASTSTGTGVSTASSSATGATATPVANSAALNNS
jgi:Tfp pilus assembly protein PilO